MIEVNCSSSELPPASRTDKGLSISWLVPSTSFVLQEYLELTAPKWTDVAVAPTLNLTYLHLEVSTSLFPGSRFYRLKQQ